MKLILTSDFHGELPEVPECDLLIIAGDICPVRDHRVSRQRKWLQGEFQDWVNTTSKAAKNIVATWGNHDFVGETEPHIEVDGVTWLVDETIEIDGLKVHGSPWCNKFFDWAFMGTEAELAAKWAMIPDDVDILFTHGPMFGVGDRTLNAHNVGSKSLADRVQDLKGLKLHVCGHIHEAYGDYPIPHSGGRSLNVSRVDYRYRAVNDLIAWEV